MRFLALIPLLSSLHLTLAAPFRRASAGIITDPTSVDGQTYDYIVVGGGLGGLTVANRLSENSDISVLVIEAGGDDRTNPVVYDIGQYGAAFDTDLDWAWASSQGRVIRGGKTLGGSTSINGADMTRGETVQYDYMSQFLGGDDNNGRWSWNGMFLGMLKSEGFSAPNDQQKEAGASSNPAYHNSTGPVQVTYPDGIYHGPQQLAFRTTVANNFSVPTAPDSDGGFAHTVGLHPSTINWQDSDHRSSAATAYFSPIEGQRTNLAILTSQLVTKILLDTTQSPVQATGVEFGTSDGTRYTVKAGREVIVSAGAIQTPALLQLSGIGDPALLNKLGITVNVENVGVGKNFQEQTIDSIGWTPVDDFDADGSGPSDCIAYPNLLSLSKSSNNNISQVIADNIGSYAQDAYDNGAVVSVDAANQLFAIQQDLMVNQGVGLVELLADTGFPNGGLGIDMWQLLPFSRGTVQITSTDPFTYPTVDPRYFSADVDMQIQIAGARMARKIFQTDPMSSLVTEENAPGYNTVAENGDGGSDDDWRAWITDGFASVHHPIATCSMMSQDLGGVVDSSLKVYGTSNLRIVDASVLPIQFSAHLSATLYGLAENAADIIKEAR